MKNFFRSLATGLALVGSALSAPAQTAAFPNSTFENWAPRSGVEAPVNWQTTDDIVEAQLGLRIPTNTVVKSTTARSGSFAAQLQTQLLLGASPVPGVVLLGNMLPGNGNADFPGGLPFTARPANVQLYYQLAGPQVAADSAVFSALLTRYVNGQTVLVAVANHVFTTPAATYTPLTLPLQYSSPLAPDTLRIVAASGTGSTITAGTVLRLDDITLTGTATGTRDAALEATLAVSPNPSPDGRYRLSSPEAAVQRAPLAVLDATGRVVRREDAPATARAERDLDLSTLPAGLYTLQLFTSTGIVARKLSR